MLIHQTHCYELLATVWTYPYRAPGLSRLFQGLHDRALHDTLVSTADINRLKTRSPDGIGVFMPTNNESFLQSTTPHEPQHLKRLRSAPEQDAPCHSAQDIKQAR